MGWKSFLLGLFVLFQLLYLPLANLIQLVPRELPAQQGDLDIRVQREGTLTNFRPVQDGINGFGSVMDRYGELSGQVQAWSLFAPDFGKQSLFPVVTFIWEEDQRVVTEIAALLPDEPGNYFRWPGPHSRINAFEYLLAVIYLNFSEASLAEHPEAWRLAVFERVRRQECSLQSYISRHYDHVRRREPGRADARWAVVSVMIIPSPEPGKRERPPTFMVPLARWEIGVMFREGRVPPMEAYDPAARVFVPVSGEAARR